MYCEPYVNWEGAESDPLVIFFNCETSLAIKLKRSDFKNTSLTLFDMGFFWTVSHGGGGHEVPPS